MKIIKLFHSEKYQVIKEENFLFRNLSNKWKIKRERKSAFLLLLIFFRSSSHGKKLLMFMLCLSVHLSLDVLITGIKDQLLICVKIKRVIKGSGHTNIIGLAVTIQTLSDWFSKVTRSANRSKLTWWYHVVDLILILSIYTVAI